MLASNQEVPCIMTSALSSSSNPIDLGVVVSGTTTLTGMPSFFPA